MKFLKLNFVPVFTALALLFTVVGAHAVPAQVLIIRHAEKPADDSERNLSPQGYRRANVLPKLFLKDVRFLEFGPPVAVYAGASQHSKKGSLRPEQTAQPTAKALNLIPNISFESHDSGSLAKDVMSQSAYNGKTVLIVWTRDELPALAHDFGVKSKDVPLWKKQTFDRVWKIRFDQSGGVSSFDDLAQKLLPGDDVN